MTAEPIAAVVADIRAGRVHHPGAFDKAGAATSIDCLTRAQLPQPVVDCTAIFNAGQVAEVIDLYNDHPSITPPWDNALLCYVNTFGNVICMQVHRRDWSAGRPDKSDWYSLNDATTDWWRVRWIADTAVWVGGRSGDGQELPTSGPCHLFRHAIYGDGSPADINWVALMARRGQFGNQHGGINDANQALWDASLITLGASLNFLSASNIDVAEPARPRAERRRLARTGVTVQTIVVRPPGKHRAGLGTARPIDPAEMVLSSVRGHWARYGPQHGRGLLFGKYSGKFWVPGHIRGAGDQAASEPKDYVLRPAGVKP